MEERGNRVGSRAYNRAKKEVANEVARKLAYRAEKLLEQGMRPGTPTGKHKWATGKEKWEAQQAAGKRHADELAGKPVRGRGKVTANQAILELLISRLTEVQAKVVSGQAPDELEIQGIHGLARQCRMAEQMTDELEMLIRMVIG